MKELFWLVIIAASGLGCMYLLAKMNKFITYVNYNTFKIIAKNGKPIAILVNYRTPELGDIVYLPNIQEFRGTLEVKNDKRLSDDAKKQLLAYMYQQLRNRRLFLGFFWVSIFDPIVSVLTFPGKDGQMLQEFNVVQTLSFELKDLELENGVPVSIKLRSKIEVVRPLVPTTEFNGDWEEAFIAPLGGRLGDLCKHYSALAFIHLPKEGAHSPFLIRAKGDALTVKKTSGVRVLELDVESYVINPEILESLKRVEAARILKDEKTAVAEANAAETVINARATLDASKKLAEADKLRMQAQGEMYTTHPELAAVARATELAKLTGVLSLGAGTSLIVDAKREQPTPVANPGPKKNP